MCGGGCDGAGNCDQLHTPVQASTPCADTDGNECTTAGCDGLGACNQRHILPDSIPCTDTDEQSCTTAGCDGAGTCDQNHITACEGCLTRTPQYWGTHPEITECFLPVLGCGDVEQIGRAHV